MRAKAWGNTLCQGIVSTKQACATVACHNAQPIPYSNPYAYAFQPIYNRVNFVANLPMTPLTAIPNLDHRNHCQHPQDQNWTLGVVSCGAFEQIARAERHNGNKVKLSIVRSSSSGGRSLKLRLKIFKEIARLSYFLLQISNWFKVITYQSKGCRLKA